MEKNNEVTILLDNEYCKVELSGSIIFGTWKDSFIDLDIAKKAVSKRLEVTEGKSYPVLINIKSVKDSTKEARDFLASEKGCEGITAGAILVDSILANMIAYLFIYLNKPQIPTKVFKDEAKAKEWLGQFVNKG